MKSQLRKPATKSVAVAKIPDSPKTFTLSMMQNMSAPKPTAPNTPNRKFLEAEAACNTEQLNLGVTHSVFSKLYLLYIFKRILMLRKIKKGKGTGF